MVSFVFCRTRVSNIIYMEEKAITTSPIVHAYKDFIAIFRGERLILFFTICST